MIYEKLGTQSVSHHSVGNPTMVDSENKQHHLHIECN